MRRGGVFVTGTDTGIGKTVVAACLVHRMGADYWKPVQTGTDDEAGDTAAIAGLTGPTTRLITPRYALAAPLSPEAAARRAGIAISLADFSLPPGDKPIVVEGAGGVLVPLGGGCFIADLIRHLGLPAILVARSTLGTINHTLLSLEALRARGIAIRGVILVGPDPAENAADIAHHGRVAILGMFPWLARIDAEAIASLAAGLEDCAA